MLAELLRGRLERDGRGLRVEPVSLAVATAEYSHVLFQLSSLGSAFCVSVLFEQFGNDALELTAPFGARRSASPRVCNVQLTRAVEHCFLQVFVEFLPSGFQHGAGIEFVITFERFRHAAIDVPSPATHVPPVADQLETPLLKRPAGVGDKSLGVEVVNLTQPVALKAHTLGTVEAEQLGAGWLETNVAMRASVMHGELLVAGFGGDYQAALAMARGQFDRFGQTGTNVGPGRKAIDHQLDIVAHPPVELQVVAQVYHRAVDSCSGETLFEKVHEQIAILTPLSADKRSQHREVCALWRGEDLLDDLFASLCGNWSATLGAMPFANPRV